MLRLNTTTRHYEYSFKYILLLILNSESLLVLQIKAARQTHRHYFKLMDSQRFAMAWEVRAALLVTRASSRQHSTRLFAAVLAEVRLRCICLVISQDYSCHFVSRWSSARTKPLLSDSEP